MPAVGLKVTPATFLFAGQIEDVTEERKDAVCRRSGVTLGSHFGDQVGDALARDFVEPETPDCRQDVDAKQIFVRLPAPFGRLGVGQVAVADELAEGWDGPQLLAASLGIFTEESPSDYGSAQTPRLLHREDTGGTNLELPLPAVGIDVALIKGSTAGRADFQQETLLVGVEEINFRATYGAGNLANKMRTESEGWHEQSRKGYCKSFNDVLYPEAVVNLA